MRLITSLSRFVSLFAFVAVMLVATPLSAAPAHACGPDDVQAISRSIDGSPGAGTCVTTGAHAFSSVVVAIQENGCAGTGDTGPRTADGGFTDPCATSPASAGAATVTGIAHREP